MLSEVRDILPFSHHFKSCSSQTYSLTSDAQLQEDFEYRETREGLSYFKIISYYEAHSSMPDVQLQEDFKYCETRERLTCFKLLVIAKHIPRCLMHNRRRVLSIVKHVRDRLLI